MVAPPLCLPQTTAFTLFLYAGLAACREQGGKSGVLAYFPGWHLEIKTDLPEYARFVPEDNLVNCPLPGFMRTTEGLCRRRHSFSEMELRAIRLNFGLSADCVPDSDELLALAFAEDEIAAAKSGLDMAADMLRWRTAKWTFKFWQEVRPFSTLGFLAALALPVHTFSGVIAGLERKWRFSFAIDAATLQNLFPVMEKVLLSGDFACLPAASPMMRSYEYECYVDDILAEIEKENPPLYGNMRENRGVYNKMIRQSA